jgi:PPP family 3-phenylpropionic acid transporter
MSPLISWLSAPLWGGIADARKQHKRLLMLAIVGAIVMVATLSFTTKFLALIPIIALFAFFSAPIFPLIDNSVMAMLGSQRDQYGKLRLWGAVGWGIVALVVGILSERSGIQWIFWGYIAFMILVWLVSYLFPVDDQSVRIRFGQEARQFLSDSRWILFLAVIFIGGASMTVIGSYLFLHIKILGGNGVLMGLALTFATISELPVLFYSNHLLTRWGARRLLVVSLGVYVIRMLALSWIRTPWFVLPLQLLHGPSFAAMWLAGVSYADELAPPGMGATAQGLFSGVMLGLGSAFGGFIGGVLFADIGGWLMYRWTAAATLIGLGLFVFAEKRLAVSQRAPHIY